MFCTKCGESINDDAVICPKCGCATANLNVQEKTEENKSNGMAIAGFVCSFFVPLLGWIFGGIGLSRAIKNKGKGKGLSIAALAVATGMFIFNFWYGLLLL